MADAVGTWITGIKNGAYPRWLTLCGTSGNGKTQCAERFWKWIDETRSKEFRDCTHNHSLVRWPDFLKELKAQTAYDLVRDMRSWPYLVLDEIGSDRDPSGFSADEVASLLGSRVGKWTLITSNLSIEEFERWDVRVASRLFRNDGIVVECNAKDYSLRTDKTPNWKTVKR